MSKVEIKLSYKLRNAWIIIHICTESKFWHFHFGIPPSKNMSKGEMRLSYKLRNAKRHRLAFVISVIAASMDCSLV